MKPKRKMDKAARAFTMVELMVAMLVMSFVVLLASQIVGETGQAISISSKTQNVDDHARLALDRIGTDLAGMLRRQDIDVIFPKQVGNDQMFFYSEAPAFFNINATLFPSSTSSDPKNTLALVGYQIDNNSSDTTYNQLERLGKGLTWDGNASGSLPGAPVFLSFLNGVIDPNSMLDGAWSADIGSAPAYNGNGTTTSAWQVLSPAVFRLEVCFLLKDGTYSTVPVRASASVPSGDISLKKLSGPPTATSDSSANYAIGSRWFDTNASRPYICTDCTPGAAIWQPLGSGDISALIVAIVAIDDSSLKIIPTSQLSTLAGIFPDITNANLSSPPTLMQQVWQAKIDSPNFATTAGIPRAAAGGVRVYQRYFYLANP